MVNMRDNHKISYIQFHCFTLTETLKKINKKTHIHRVSLHPVREQFSAVKQVGGFNDKR